VITRTHAPALQVRSGAHVAPSFAGVVPFSQVWVPVAHEVMPATQMFGFVAHGASATQPTQLPPLQTWSVPHEVPFAFRVAVSAQLREPVAQDSTPSTQGFGFVEHAAPPAHATHAPALQTWFVPQLVPFTTCAAVSMHCWVPLEQEVLPTRHRFGFVVHVWPAVQVVQTPPLHTWSVPQTVPFATCAKVSTHVCEPVAQEVSWTVHEFAGVQSTPAVQATHAPLPLQTKLVPQVVPAAFGVAVLSQVCEPVAQEKTPSTHGFGLVAQAPPAVQATHDPALQTWSVPQLVPFGSGVAVSTHVCVPLAHDVVPVRHGSGFVMQAAPATQPTQLPPLQTRFEPQVVPFGSGAAALSTQTDVPVEQEVMPVRHGAGFVAQVWPAVHATQAPPLQTWSVPQEVPLGMDVPLSTHVVEPVAQEVTPARQAVGFVPQASPAVQPVHTPPLQT
jgi:hypothetical protein